MEQYWLTTHKPIAEWLHARGYVFTGPEANSGNLAIAWSTRIGIDFTDLEFWPWVNRAGVACVNAIIGHHASGTNPRLQIGTCESLDEVKEVHDLIRRLNGYERPEPERTAHA